MRSDRKWVATCGLAFLFLVTDASGAVIGHLDIANCAGGGVTVSATFIDFTLPVNSVGSPGTGCIQTGSSTNVSFGAGSTLGPGITGTILDLVFNPANPPVPGFMTFVGTNLDFTLMSLGPGVNNAVCAATLDPNLPTCSVGGNTPFILTPTSTGTSITLSASGTVSDGTSPPSNFIGAFTTQIAGVTPASIQATIVGGGSITSTTSGDFTITSGIPEPNTISMAVLGGLLVAFAATRRKSRV
jgi:hypothetical protein